MEETLKPSLPFRRTRRATKAPANVAAAPAADSSSEEESDPEHAPKGERTKKIRRTLKFCTKISPILLKVVSVRKHLTEIMSRGDSSKRFDCAFDWAIHLPTIEPDHSAELADQLRNLHNLATYYSLTKSFGMIEVVWEELLVAKARLPDLSVEEMIPYFSRILEDLDARTA